MREAKSRASSKFPDTAALPKGIAFDIADLVRARGWAVLQGWSMQVLLDHGAEDEEYEEVIEFCTGPSSSSKTILWRNENFVFVQPILGRKQRYRSVVNALRSLGPMPRTTLTDIVATSWPIDPA